MSGKNTTNTWSAVVLRDIVGRDDVEELSVAIEDGLDPKSWLDADSRESLLAIAVRENSTKATALLIEHGGDWSLEASFDEDLESPLALAIELGSDEILRVFADSAIIQEYSRSWLQDALGRLPLRSRRPSDAVLRILEAANERPEGLLGSVADSRLARTLAKQVKTLEKDVRSPSFEIRVGKILSSLELAGKSVSLLLKEVEELAATCHSGKTRSLLESLPVSLRKKAAGVALVYASRRADWSFSEELLDMGADCAAQLSTGSTALMYAAQRGNLALVRRLLEGGADPFAREEEARGGRTAMDMAGSPLIRRYLEKLTA